MGGYGSTRWAWHTRRRTVEESQKLSVRDLELSILADPQWCWYTRAGVGLRLGTATEQQRPDGVKRAQRSITLDTSEFDSAQTVELVGHPMRFGGVRWWFQCPNCSRRRNALYLIRSAGTSRWGCRQCYGLTYLTQRLEPMARLEVRMRRAASRLHPEWENWFHCPPPKPKWMRWPTYERRCATWHRASQARDWAWIRGVQPFLTRMKRHTR
jgi:hypothetical protein